jgi:biopolymer transport protein ExbD
MRFRQLHHASPSPEANLVPMMDVLMTVLTFFVIVSMSLSTGQKILNVPLPLASLGAGEVKAPNPLEVGLTQEGQILLAGQPVNEAQLGAALQAYLGQQPTGTVILKADRQLPYGEVGGLLKAMQKIGGDRVSLAIEQR